VPSRQLCLPEGPPPTQSQPGATTGEIWCVAPGSRAISSTNTEVATGNQLIVEIGVRWNESLAPTQFYPVRDAVIQEDRVTPAGENFS